MLDHKFRKKGLLDFDFKATAWYQTIRNEARSFKFQLLMFFLLAVLAVSSGIFLHLQLSGTHPFSSLYALISVLSAILLVLLGRFRRIRLMVYLVLGVSVAGIGYSFLVGSSIRIYLVLSVVFPIMALLLKGTVKGSLWYAASVAVLCAAWLSQFAGATLPWARALPSADYVASFFLSFLVYVLTFWAERRHERMVDRLTDILVFDDATGLPNKDVLVHTISREHAYVFAIIKIENFSDLVALFGYEFSETISQFASQKLRKYEARFGYRTYQLKYNEYGLLLETPASRTVVEAAQILSEIVKSLEIESLPWERDRIRLVFRVGGCVVKPGEEGNPLSRADVALKKAERGYSSITIYEDDNTEKKTAYDYVIKFTELVTNRENDSFKAVFQPVFRNNGTDIAWYEALLRIRRQDGSYVSIYPYLNVAKSTGFYQYLTDFVIRKSAEAICEYDVDVSVNISIHDIVRPEFIQRVDEAYEMIKDKRGRIIFEILESDELVELDKCIWFIDYIERYHFSIAIDDFGTGYSNYCNLINLPVDIVKIDGSLIKKIKTDENAKLLVEGIIHFCEKSNKKTVAEYVEDKHVFDSLRTMNIDFLQGYYLGEPAARAQFSPSSADDTIPPA